MKIPSEFQVMGHTITVKFVSKSFAEELEFLGRYNHLEHTLELKRGMTDSQTLHTFFHEIMHCVLDSLNEEELSKDEKLVDNIGGLLAQAIASSK